MNTNNYFSKHVVPLAMLLLMLLAGTNATAQNVTISPQNGSMICALTSGSQQTQLGFQIGAFGTWRHNQLSLTMTGSNYATLTEDGQLSQHSNHFITGDNCEFSPADDTRTPSRYIVADWGGENLNTGYITIALPKGYRFTSYTFHLSHDVSKFGKNNTAFDLTTNTRVYMTETNNSFSGNLNRVTLEGNSKEVKEFTRTGDDMGNILYFTTSANSNGFYAVTFRYIELKFTADADASVSLLPSTQTTTGHSMMEIPFNTGKVDLGEIKQGTYQGAQRVSYQYNSVSDMSANMLLYEYESTKSGTALDGTEGLVAYDKEGSITTSGEYFKFSPSKNKTEQKYVLETPVSATMSNNKENPVQFRITEATIHYSGESSNTFYITFKDDNGTKYYLNTNGRFSTTEQTVWSIDDDGHIKSGNNYLQGTNGNVDAGSSYWANTYSIDENGNIRYERNNGRYRYLKAFPNYSWEYQGGDWVRVLSYYTGYMTDSNNYTTATTEVIQDEAHSGAELYVYDKEGNTKETIEISGKGTKTLYDLNNDAIIIGVKGGKVALLNFELKLQALNPYIDNMTVVLTDTYKGKNIRQTRTFTADDFSVGGDTFKFYLPTGCIHDPLTITFEDLYSKYGDDTYDHTNKPGTSNSRYNFVMSQHHQKFTDDNIYNGKAEAASGTLESARIKDDANVRTKVGIVGNKAFRFNNADELADHDGYLTEYPFTLDNYAKQTKPGKGEFVVAGFNENIIDDQDWEEKTFYVFTTDETCYNIAPTTATQHRFYAFYEMVVQVLCDDYEPEVEFVPIYEKTFIETQNGSISEAPFFGVKVTGPAGVDSPLASDVATYEAISKAVAKGDDKKVPKTLEQILYVDLSGLNGVYHSEETGTYALKSFNEFKELLAPNALIFLPANSTDRFDNFAYAKKGEVAGSFQSANNIILTDKTPFYSPYDIQVDAANYALYTRKVTKSSYGEVRYATVTMPFTIKFDEDGEKGVKTDSNYGKLKFLQMNTNNATADDYDYGTAFFSPAQGKQVEANTPYALQVLENKSEDSFTLRQYGSNIAATPNEAKAGNSLFSATEIISTGNLKDKDNNANEFKFSHKGSFSGYKIPKNSPLTFYFAKNGFYKSSDLIAAYPNVELFPFRSVYEVTSSKPITANPIKATFFNIVIGENDQISTGIQDNDNKYGEISVGNGTITINAGNDNNYKIFSVAGLNTHNIDLKAGESRTISVPSGVYLVNGLKVMVK